MFMLNQIIFKKNFNKLILFRYRQKLTIIANKMYLINYEYLQNISIFYMLRTRLKIKILYKLTREHR